LSAVSGVYVIRDMNPAGGGRLYVGSAVGSEGIWGRWVGYGSDKWHNGNVALKALYEQDPDYKRHFQFGILQVMSRGTADRDVLAAESSYKNKLGSRVISLGLNRN
jgi:hypothetical protein